MGFFSSFYLIGFNGLYRPHLIITYIVDRQGEYEAGWQLNQTTYEQWKTAIDRLLEPNHAIE